MDKNVYFIGEETLTDEQWRAECARVLLEKQERKQYGRVLTPEVRERLWLERVDRLVARAQMLCAGVRIRKARRIHNRHQDE